jgi:hypothetical protein
MNGDRLLINPDFWIDKADELRAIAEAMRPGPHKEQLLRVADLDEAIGRRALEGLRPLDQALRVEEARDG